MQDRSSYTCLLASRDPALLASLEPVLLALNERVQIVLSIEDALTCLCAPELPGLVLLDAGLSVESPAAVAQLLAAARAHEFGRELEIVLISDTVIPEWSDRLSEGVLDGLMPCTAGPDYWRVHIEQVRRSSRQARELEKLHEAALLHTQLDGLTGAYNRATIMAMLLRETDRAQRMKSALSVVLFDVDDFGHWNSRLGTEACDDLLRQVAGRTTRLLRSYDLLGRPGKDEFLVALPGCSVMDAIMLAERLRVDVFATPFRISGESIRLSACFGVAVSHGRSPVIVLREAEQALSLAKEEGPETIHCYDGSESPARAPVTFLSPSGDELLAW